MSNFASRIFVIGTLLTGIFSSHASPTRRSVTPATKKTTQPRPLAIEQATAPVIGGIAPSFETTYFDVGYKTSWKSIDHLGREAILLVIVPPDTPVEQIETATKSLDGGTLGELKKRKSTILLAFPDEKSIREVKPQGGAGEAISVVDTNGAIRRLYAPDAKTITLIEIDKAGFLRCVTPSSEPATVGRQLLQATDHLLMLEEGKTAPDFQIRDMNGRMRRLSDLRGRRNLILTFFPKCFTFTCTAQLTSLRDSTKQLNANDTEIWAVSTDAAEGERGQRAFARYLNLKFPLIPDMGRNLSILYTAVNSPNQVSGRMSVLIDKNGIVRWIDKQIDPRRHGTEMLDKLHELSIDKTSVPR